MENRATNNDINSAAVDPITPNDHDIFCGRGGRVISHIGNLNYRELVERLKLFYFANPKTHKRYVAQSIVMAIASQDPPGRFLRKDPGTDQWIVITEEEAIRITQHALREDALINTLEQEEFDTSDIDRKLLKETLQVLLDDLEDPMKTDSHVENINDNVRNDNRFVKNSN